MISEASKRYAKAIYDIAKSNNSSDKMFAELTALANIIHSDVFISDFILSPIIAPEQKILAIKGALLGKVSQDIVNVLNLLAEKNRLNLFSEIVKAYELISDEAKGVTRGIVRSAAQLNADEKQRIEDTVTKVTKKQVILNFVEDKTLLGGMVAQVGGWTFDDSLDSHLTSLSENLNRRA